MARPGSAGLLLATALIALCASRTPAAGAARHDAAPPSYKLLTVIPLGGSSHTFDLVAVAGTLANRHNVTVATPSADYDHTAAAIKRVVGAGPVQIQRVDELLPSTDFAGVMGGPMKKGGPFGMVRRFSRLSAEFARRCERLVENRTLLEDWRSYDAILTVMFPPPTKDGCMCVIAHLLGIPLVHVRDFLLMDAPLSVPQIGSGLTQEQVRSTWTGAIKNTFHWAMLRASLTALGVYEVRANKDLRSRLGLPLGGKRGGLTCRPLVEVVSNSWLFENPRPLEPDQVMIGAVSPRPSSPTIPDPEVAAFAAEAAADDGLVLVSFGSVSSFFGTLLTWDDYTGLSAAFADLAPVRVLWLLHPAALGNRTVDELPLGANTMVVPWGPINDVLGHPSCRAFVTHGGLKSTLEAMFHGVPIVGVPFMNEQLLNCQRTVTRGFGVVSPEAPASRKEGVHYTRKGMASLIKQVLSPSYATAANQIGAAMRLAYRQKRPVDRAAEEVELALLHGGYSMEHSLAQARLREARHRADSCNGGEEGACGMIDAAGPSAASAAVPHTEWEL